MLYSYIRILALCIINVLSEMIYFTYVAYYIIPLYISVSSINHVLYALQAIFIWIGWVTVPV